MLEEAGRRKQPVILEVLEPNLRARILYERSGSSAWTAAVTTDQDRHAGRPSSDLSEAGC